MLLRSFRPSDIAAIDKVYKLYHSDSFGIPDLSHVLTQRVVTDDDDVIIAYGMVKLFAEAIMVLDLGASQRDKVEALRLLMGTAIADAKSAKLAQLHGFVKDKSFIEVLKKHYNFIPCSGEALVALL